MTRPSVVGVKVGLVYFNHEGLVDFKIPTALSLGVTFGLLVAGVLYSLWKTRDQDKNCQ